MIRDFGYVLIGVAGTGFIVIDASIGYALIGVAAVGLLCDRQREENSMGQHTHIDAKGRFQSDLHSEIPPDKILLSFKDPRARRALAVLATDYADADDGQLSRDLMTRIGTFWGARSWLRLSAWVPIDAGR